MKWDLGLVLAVVVTTPASAENWKHLAETTTGSIVYVDVDSARILPPVPNRRPFEARQIWSKSDHKADKTEKARETLTLIRVNCGDDTMLIVSYATYDANGIAIGGSEEQDYAFKYRHAIPGTIGSAQVDFVCGRSALSPENR